MDYTHYKKQLEARKREIEQRLIDHDHFGLERGFASDMASGELSQYDNHPADSGTELYEREKDIALLGHLREELSDIQYSLKQMQKGTYGICEETGQPIPKERLEALPTARTVASTSTNEDVFSDRPVEEDVLEDLEANYGRHHDDPEYNEQNAYEQVASFNESSMTYDDSSLMDNQDGVGYVEEFEPFVSTDMNGYTGADGVTFQRNEHYDKYMDNQDEAEAEDKY
ncbi:regulatory protein, yteA family [Halobacillus karajensis]|uniref:General stress protein 16O n=1 Tax=Halobacillus karajensis TaxID=195088 RepID=A0A024P674_9BACI|nr:TraR/DksA C4-type zinc finger protein [Halobacillus karajensis]CDQ20395.1 General stress protein 16O [Halobacillus karajensis]CDQ24136.1 General stress protein 16O [Halobacillus karajensis]CDQ27614.1 General stress protein 16O [Halobacillus karajensis]SEH92311.1 regulatory protein, yteA family [Halobacillus karajensis]